MSRRTQHSHSSRPSLGFALTTLAGGFLGMAAIGLVDSYLLSDADLGYMIGAFGATCVLVFGAPGSPLAQPFNVLVGHVVSAAIGVAAFKLLGAGWLAAAAAVSLSIFAMQMTRSVHPPGGASALIAVAGSPQIHDLGFLYPLFPVAAGALLLVAIALVVNNLHAGPQRWPVF